MTFFLIFIEKNAKSEAKTMRKPRPAVLLPTRWLVSLDEKGA